jgi:hypothetical protein
LADRQFEAHWSIYANFFINALITFHIGIKSNIIIIIIIIIRGGGGLISISRITRDILLESTLGMQTQGTRSAGELNCVRWLLVFVEPPYEICFMSFLWSQEFLG